MEGILGDDWFEFVRGLARWRLDKVKWHWRRWLTYVNPCGDVRLYAVNRGQLCKIFHSEAEDIEIFYDLLKKPGTGLVDILELFSGLTVLCTQDSWSERFCFLMQMFVFDTDESEIVEDELAMMFTSIGSVLEKIGLFTPTDEYDYERVAGEAYVDWDGEPARDRLTSAEVLTWAQQHEDTKRVLQFVDLLPRFERAVVMLTQRVQQLDAMTAHIGGARGEAVSGGGGEVLVITSPLLRAD